MATGTITNFATISGTDYCKMSDGTLICWGTLTIPANAGKGTVSLPISFANTAYKTAFSPVFSQTSDVTLSVGIKTVSTFEIFRKTTTASSQPADWIAIGRWK